MKPSTPIKKILDVQRIYLALGCLGIDVNALFRELRITEMNFNPELGGISLLTYLELLNRTVEKYDRPLLGIEIANTRDLSCYGAFGYMIQNSRNFANSIELIDRYLELATPGAFSRLIKQGERCIWSYELIGISPASARHDVELSLAEFIRATRSLLDLSDWKPEHIYLQHAKPQWANLLEEAFQCEISFSHHLNGVEFSSFFLDFQISNADPRLLDILESNVKDSIERLKSNKSLVERLTFFISSNIGQQKINPAALASAMGLSQRTLQRRLANLGTSVDQLREEILLQVAKQSLATTPVSVAVIAQELGYSDSSAFNRAFKRLCSETPLEYRRMHQH